MFEPEAAPLPGRVFLRRPGPEVARAWEAIGGGATVRLEGMVQRTDTLPAIVGETEGRTYTLLLSLYGDDLVIFGFPLQPDLCRPGLGQEMLGMAEATARRTGRTGVQALLTNADIVPLYFLQRQGFRLHEVRHLVEGGFGYQGLPRTHELILRRSLAEGG
jgi:hypothetical protein